MLKRGFFVSLAAGLGFACEAQSTAPETRSLAEIYEAAQKESGTLMVYFGGSSQSAAVPLIDASQKLFPDIPINITVKLSKYADSLIDRSYVLEKPYVDVAFLQTVHDFSRWDKEQKLLHYKPLNFDDINPAIRDVDGAFFPIAFNQFGPFYYDSTEVPAERVPTSYKDVLDSYWKGKLVLTYPNDDDGVLYLFKLIIQRYGFEWLDSLLKQDVQWVRGATAATGTIIRDHNSGNGSRVLTFSGLGGFTPATSFLKVQQPKFPDEFMTWAQRAAIFNWTPRPESSRLLASFLLSDEWQVPIAENGAPSVRRSLASKYGRDVFQANNTQPSDYITFMNDREEVEWWRFQLETSIGLAVGPNPA